MPLREALARYLRTSRGVKCSPDQILITNGAQEALSLCSSVVLDSTSTVLMENPGYRRARCAFDSAGAKMHLSPLKNGYLDVDALIKKETGRLVYTTPTHQYPMGGVMPAADRLKLLDWATKTRCWIIEDDYDSEFSFDNKPVAALQGMGEHTPVFYMGSFSKTLQPALRIGYLVVPVSVMPAFLQAKGQFSGQTNLVTQAALADFINEGHLVRHLRKMRINYSEKWQHICDLIRTELEPNVKLIASSTGMHVVLSVDCDDVALSKQLSGSGFGSTPLSFFYPNKADMKGLVLGFANTSQEQRIECIQNLKKLIVNCALK